MFSAGDIAELEKKYSLYIKKRMIKLFLFFFSFIIILLLLFYFFWYEKGLTKAVNTQEINQTQMMQAGGEAPLAKVSAPSNIKTAVSKKNSQPLLPTSPNNRDQTAHVLAPTLNIESHSDTNVTQSNALPSLRPQKNHLNVTNSNTLVLKLPTIELEPEKKAPTLTKKVAHKVNNTKVKQEEKKPLEKKDFGIKIETKSIDSITYLKDRFNENHSIIYALMLCKEYYQKKDFANTLKWSVIANDIDNTSEKSWIWFAKSKYKLGKKDDAIEALKAFLKTNNSSKIKSLLHDIINGELYD